MEDFNVTELLKKHSLHEKLSKILLFPGLYGFVGIVLLSAVLASFGGKYLAIGASVFMIAVVMAALGIVILIKQLMLVLNHDVECIYRNDKDPVYLVRGNDNDFVVITEDEFKKFTDCYRTKYGKTLDNKHEIIANVKFVIDGVTHPWRMLFRYTYNYPMYAIYGVNDLDEGIAENLEVASKPKTEIASELEANMDQLFAEVYEGSKTFASLTEVREHFKSVLTANMDSIEFASLELKSVEITNNSGDKSIQII